MFIDIFVERLYQTIIIFQCRGLQRSLRGSLKCIEIMEIWVFKWWWVTYVCNFNVTICSCNLKEMSWSLWARKWSHSEAALKSQATGNASQRRICQFDSLLFQESTQWLCYAFYYYQCAVAWKVNWIWCVRKRNR